MTYPAQGVVFRSQTKQVECPHGERTMAMLIFVVVLIVAAAIGGFGVGQVTGDAFSILGAAGGAVATFAVLMGLGAFFDAQEKKRDKSIDHVFDRMVTGKEKPTRAEVEAGKKRMR